MRAEHHVQSPYRCTAVVVGNYTKEFAPVIADYIKEHSRVPFKNIVCVTEKVEEHLCELKACTGGSDATDADKIVLLPHGAIGAEAIRYLCDDADRPPHARRVAWIHSISVGLDAYRFGEIADQVASIPISNSKGSQSPALAEYAFAAFGYFNRNYPRMQQLKRQRAFTKYDMNILLGRRLAIFGYGDIGEHVARIGRGFGMHVEAVKRSPPKHQTASIYVDDKGAKVYTELLADPASAEAAAAHRQAFIEQRDRMLAEADYIVNTLPGTPETVNFFDKHTFAKMKPSVVYVNVGRGITNDEDDIVAALMDGRIRGAAIDVFRKEPLPSSSPLWDVPDEKLILTAHTGAQTTDQLTELAAGFLQLCEKWDRGEDLDTAYVNREFWY